jgi:predicted nucleic acid-binding protein
MTKVLVDANILIDLFTNDPEWADWSESALAEALEKGGVMINPIVYAEVSIAFSSTVPLDAALERLRVQRSDLPYEAAFLAGKAFLKYRKRGGLKRSPLPDFYIGAHAQNEAIALLTRDPSRYRTYFPQVKLICPSP